MLHTYRKQDAVIVVCQNNDKQMVEIAALNERAAQLVGYQAEELVGKPLVEYVSSKLADLINEELNFKDSGYDFGDVLSKTYDVQFIHQNGQELWFRLRLVRSEALGRNPVFHLVLQEEEVFREHESFKRILSENFKGHEVIDKATGLPDRHSLLKNIELVQYYTKKRDFMACFAVMELDNYDAILAEKGEEYCIQAIAHIGHTCRQKLRKEDAEGLMSARAVGLIMMQITPESSRIVLNRLRWSINSMPLIMNDGNKLEATVSVSFIMTGETDPDQLMLLCEKQLQTERGKGGNLMHEVS
jgi:PAS domain S-box-containing protein